MSTEKVNSVTPETLTRPSPSIYLHIDAREQPELHVILDHGLIPGWSVWLNTGIADFDGLCIVAGADTREAAMGKASALLQRLADRLDHCVIHGTDGVA